MTHLFILSSTDNSCCLVYRKFKKYEKPSRTQPHDGSNSRHWRSDFHPFFGTCFVFSMESETGAVASALGAAGPSSVVVSVNLARAFPDLSPPPPPCDEERGDYCGPPVASPGDHIDAEHVRIEKILMNY